MSRDILSLEVMELHKLYIYIYIFLYSCLRRASFAHSATNDF